MDYDYHRRWIGARHNWLAISLDDAERYMLDFGLTLTQLHERGTVRLAYLIIRATRRTAAARLAAN